jgi:membrane protease YdiL (CAAX protease family)
MSQTKPSVLWLCTGAMVLIVAMACGNVLSGAATALAAKAGAREDTIAIIAVATLILGFAMGAAAGLRDLMGLARRQATSLPWRWIVGSIAVMFVAAPFWNVCVVHIQEPISGSDAVRTLFDNVHYALVLTLIAPLGMGVPLMLARLRRQCHLSSLPPTEQNIARTPS